VNDSSNYEAAVPSGNGGLVIPHEIRLRLDLAYDGTEFSGWARQPERRTVQGVVEEALALVLRLDAPQVTVAGRTDAGVHATGQVAHVDVPAPDDVEWLARRLNGVLPDDVVISAVSVAAPEFDARFAALGRRYDYRITDGTPNPLNRHDTVFWPRPLDEAAMNAAAQGLVGLHDFAAYAKPREGATTIRTLHQLTASRSESVVTITAHADAFCHNQVRSMVGALIAVGEGRVPVEWPGEVLASGTRSSTVHVAPAHGLTLVAVDYPPDADLAARAAVTRRRREGP
jgi:tRNA pseudouridine38-40 synthase